MSLQTSLDPILREAAASYGIPGIVGMAANSGGVIYEGAFGRLGVDREAPMQVDSVFRIASMTKAITAAAAMQLIEEGRIGLDQDAGEIVDGLRAPQVLEGFDEAGQPKLRAARGPVTVRHLLTHTSGFGYDLFHADLARYMQLAGLPSIATCLDGSLKAPLLFDPGTRWEYGIGLDWIGKIVEAVSGKRLEDYVAEKIAGPLGMKDTTFKPDAALRQRMVSAHALGPDGNPNAIGFEFPSDGDFVMGGGGLVSTAPDYIRFTRMILNQGSLDGVQVLQPETVALMRGNQIGDLDVPTTMKSDNPAMALTVELLPGVTKKWGLSYLLNVEPLPTGRGAGALSWSGVLNTFFWIDPERDLTAVLMMQLLPAGAPPVIEALLRFEIGLYRALRK